MRRGEHNQSPCSWSRNRLLFKNRSGWASIFPRFFLPSVANCSRWDTVNSLYWDASVRRSKITLSCKTIKQEIHHEMKHIQKRLDCCIAIQYNEINIQLLCSRAAAFRWGFGPPLTYVCGYCKRRRGLSLKTHYDLMLQSYYLTEMNIYGRNTWKTLAHSAAHSSSLSLSEIHNKMSAANVAKSRSYCSKKKKKQHRRTLTASIMTECGVLAVKTKPSPLAALTSAPSSGEEAW